MPAPVKLGGRALTRIKRRVEQDKYDAKFEQFKTLKMLRLEQELGAPIQKLLREGSGTEVARKLGVTQACVSRWRKKFHIQTRYRGVAA